MSIFSFPLPLPLSSSISAARCSSYNCPGLTGTRTASHTRAGGGRDGPVVQRRQDGARNIIADDEAGVAQGLLAVVLEGPLGVDVRGVEAPAAVAHHHAAQLLDHVPRRGLARGVAARVGEDEAEGQTSADRRVRQQGRLRRRDDVAQLLQVAVGPRVDRDVRREGERDELVGPVKRAGSIEQP